MKQNNIRFVVGSASDNAVLTSNSEVTPVSYLQRDAKELGWRSLGPTSTIEGELPTPAVINCMILADHNFSASTTVRLELEFQGVTVYDSGLRDVGTVLPAGFFQAGIDPWAETYDELLPIRHARIWLPQKYAADKFKITIVDSNMLHDYLQVNRLFMGSYFSPRVNFSYGATMTYRDSSNHILTEGGIVTERGSIRRSFKVDLGVLEEFDRAKLEMEFGLSGKWRDVFVSGYPEEGGMKEVSHSMLARREDDFAHSHPAFQTWQSSLTFIEL